MIDLNTGFMALGMAAVIAVLVHLLIPYVGRASFLGWVFLQALLLGWMFTGTDEIYRNTLIVVLMPSALVILVIGIPFELQRRRRMRRIGLETRKSGGFACPHCGCIYDRAREQDRCPDCGGAVDGAPGVLG